MERCVVRGGCRTRRRQKKTSWPRPPGFRRPAAHFFAHFFPLLVLALFLLRLALSSGDGSRLGNGIKVTASITASSLPFTVPPPLPLLGLAARNFYARTLSESLHLLCWLPYASLVLELMPGS